MNALLQGKVIHHVIEHRCTIRTLFKIIGTICLEILEKSSAVCDEMDTFVSIFEHCKENGDINAADLLEIHLFYKSISPVSQWPLILLLRALKDIDAMNGVTHSNQIPQFVFALTACGMAMNVVMGASEDDPAGYDYVFNRFERLVSDL